MSKKELIFCGIIAVLAALIIILPQKRIKEKNIQNEELGDIVISEDNGIDITETEGEIDGPSGGDGYMPENNFQIQNASSLIDAGAEIDLVSQVNTAFKKLLKDNKKYDKIQIITIDFSTYNDNDNQTVFEMTTDLSDQIRYKGIYNKATRQLTYTVSVDDN